MEKYGIGPREIGQIKEGIKEAILEGEIRNEREPPCLKWTNLRPY